MGERLVDLRQQLVLGIFLATVGVETAQADEEHLPPHTQVLPAGNDARHGTQLFDHRIFMAIQPVLRHGQQA